MVFLNLAVPLAANRDIGVEPEYNVGCGSTAVFKRCLRHVRYHPNSGAKTDIPALRICANRDVGPVDNS